MSGDQILSRIYVNTIFERFTVRGSASWKRKRSQNNLITRLLV